jgi:hypothetical protein
MNETLKLAIPVFLILLFISDKGEIQSKHRKLMPTNCERTIWTK